MINLSDKSKKGMINFHGENTDQEADKIRNKTDICIPDEIFQEISLMYFNEVYTRYIKELNELKEEIKEMKEILKRR